MTLELIEHKEIDSIIDEAKASGLYSIESLNLQPQNEESIQVDDYWSDSNESLCCDSKSLGNKSLTNSWESTPKLQQAEQPISLNTLTRSDSDVTIIRVKRQRLKTRKQINTKWASIHDKAVPGDGTHLAESPSLVNLVTFVKSDTNIKKEAGEYLVPISSWDPIHDVKKKLENFQSKSNEFEEIHRSLNISGISNSRLNIPYMMKQKLSPRPGALFSQNPAITKFESDKNVKIGNNKEFQMIKAPPSVIYQRLTFKQRLQKFVRAVFCACCIPEPVYRKPKNTFEIGVQTLDNDSEYCVITH